MKVIYTKGHINTIQPYYFMLNGQRYNAAHFNENTVFGWYVAPPTISTTAINVTTTIVDITTTDQADEIWWAVNTPTNFQRYTGVVRLNNRPQAIFAYAKVDGTMSRIVRTPVVADPVLTVDYGSAYGQVIWFNNDSGKPMYWTEDNWTTMNSVSNGGHAALDYTMNVKCQAMWNGIWSNEVTQLCLWDVPEPGIVFDDDTIIINTNYTGSTSINIYYRLGTTGNYSLYTSPIEISGAVTVYAYSAEADYPTNISNVVSLACSTYETPFYVRQNGFVRNPTFYVEFIKNDDDADTLTIEYSTDKLIWHVAGNTSTSGVKVYIDNTKKTYFRCNTNSWNSVVQKPSGVEGETVSTRVFNIIAMGIEDTNGVPNPATYAAIGGNIMSLLYGNNFTGEERSFPSNVGFEFEKLFHGSTNYITKADKLLLPATTLNIGSYYCLFVDCRVLLSTPELPATTLAMECYGYMFDGCTSLTTAPELPATTLVNGCYNAMFRNCTHLTNAPELSSNTLAGNCYYRMFYGCTALTAAPELPATTLASGCYDSMFYGCTALTAAPELPATTLANACYMQMFYHCSSLNNIKCLATSGLDNQLVIDAWVDGVAATGTFTKKAGVTWPIGVSGIPNNWTVVEV